jgi:hypothetical protein
MKIDQDDDEVSEYPYIVALLFFIRALLRAPIYMVEAWFDITPTEALH